MFMAWRLPTESGHYGTVIYFRMRTKNDKNEFYLENTMSRKTNLTIFHLTFKTAITVPVIVTGLLIHAGELILKKSVPFLSDEHLHHPAPETSDKNIYSGKDSEVSVAPDTVFGMRQFGPKIYIRK